MLYLIVIAMCLVAQKQTKTEAESPLVNSNVVGNAHNYKTDEVYNQLQVTFVPKLCLLGSYYNLLMHHNSLPNSNIFSIFVL
jgi:hypothetical protein